MNFWTRVMPVMLWLAEIAHESFDIGAGEPPRVIPINPILPDPLDKLLEIVTVGAKGFG